MITQGKIWKMLGIFAAVCLLSVSLLGIAYSGMHMSGTGDNMPVCPFMGETGICQMTPFEHLAVWQSMFASIPQLFTVLGLLLLITLFALSFLFKDFLPKKEPDQGAIFYTPPDIVIFNPLKFAFARGIIHPKVF